MVSHRNLSALAFLAAIAAAPAAAQSENPRELEKPCRQGAAMSCANLAVLYKHGRGVTQDHVRALTLFVKACEGGVDFACGNVGDMTYRGVGVAANRTQGASLIRGACRRGDAWSCETARRHAIATSGKEPA